MPSGKINELLIAIWMVTYNQSKFIEQALESVMMQKTNFKYKVFLGEDCSTDETRDICLKLKEKYPDKITLVLNEVNIGASNNAQNIFDLCFNSGAKYIAMLEGDDYWTDPLKLQKQVDFLEANLDYVLHSGKAQIMRENKLEQIIGLSKSKNSYSLEDFYTRNNLITCTVMFRNKFAITKSFPRVIFGDWKLYTVLLSQTPGSLAYVSDELYSVYRIHAGGIMQTVASQIDSAKAHLMQIESIKKDLSCNFTNIDIGTINSYCISLFHHHLSRGNYKESILVLFRNILLVGAEIPLRNYLGLVKFLMLKKSA